jgi:hypothetical protein
MQITSSSTTLGLVTTLSFVLLLFSNPVVMAHTFSENENALFLTMINKIKAETQLVARDATNNTQQAQVHAKAALGILTQNDPLVNTTWTSQISELNPRVTADLVKSINDLSTVAPQGSNPSSSNSSSILLKVANIDSLLDEAATVRISSNLLNNSRTQALVLANLGNEIYNNYGKALGISESTVASMGGMKITGMNVNTAANSSGSTGMSSMNIGSNKSSMNMGTGSSGAMSAMNSMNGQAAMNQNNPSIKNMTAYQTAQSLASIAQQVFVKNFKPIAPFNATSSTINVGKYIDQLKSDINNKASFATVMETVHVKLHPTLINTYKITTG